MNQGCGSSIWFVCRYCNRAFVRKKFLARHKREFHPNNEQQKTTGRIVVSQRDQVKPDSYSGHVDVSQEMEETLPAVQLSANRTTFDKNKKNNSFGSNIIDDDKEDGDERNSEVNHDKMHTVAVHDDDTDSDIDENHFRLGRSCRVCNKVFYNEDRWLNHRKVHTDNESGGLGGSENGSFSRPKFGMTSNTPASSQSKARPLKILNRTGSASSTTYTTLGVNSSASASKGKETFECIYCKKKISTSWNLKIHERIHTGERPYKCRYCSKAFSASRGRRAHERVHTGERPYPCWHCPKSFAAWSSRNIHVKRIHQ